MRENNLFGHDVTVEQIALKAIRFRASREIPQKQRGVVTPLLSEFRHGVPRCRRNSERHLQGYCKHLKKADRKEPCGV